MPKATVSKRTRQLGPVIDRLANRLAMDDFECLVWTGPLNHAGYGYIRIDGKQHLTHRLYYTLAVGPIPDGMQIDHMCRNRACAFPPHLDVVTPTENTLRGKWNLDNRKVCKRGHPLPESIYVRPDGRRECGECSRMRAYRWLV